MPKDFYARIFSGLKTFIYRSSMSLASNGFETILCYYNSIITSLNSVSQV